MELKIFQTNAQWQCFPKISVKEFGKDLEAVFHENFSELFAIKFRICIRGNGKDRF
jgi:hypothetical protein